MYRLIARLVVYRDFEKDNILMPLAKIIKDFDTGLADETLDREELVSHIYAEIHKLLDVATRYGFDDNLWHNYLTYLLVTNENPFSITCEKAGDRGGSVTAFAKNDFKVIKALFNYDFSKIEKELDINCFTVIENYHSIKKSERVYNANVSERVRTLSKKIEAAADENEIYDLVTESYKDYGVGKFGLNKAFRVKDEDGSAIISPITNIAEIKLSDIIGYDEQKRQLIENTRAFTEGKKANNTLLYGDAGTGKSTSIKAVLNEFYPDGLRMIEIYKHQFGCLADAISQIKNRNYRFIIYMDDLSFEDFEIEYKYLKAVIEGGLEVRPENVLIYATSNRRHLIKESFNDRNDMGATGDVHHSDTIQEKLSLVARFGLKINYSAPNQDDYFNIVRGIAANYDKIKLSDEELTAGARQFAIAAGGRSGRTARQYINYLLSEL